MLFSSVCFSLSLFSPDGCIHICVRGDAVFLSHSVFLLHSFFLTSSSLCRYEKTYRRKGRAVRISTRRQEKKPRDKDDRQVAVFADFIFRICTSGV